MSERIHALAQHLLGKATIEECDLQEVKLLAGRFPYFAPAQFLLLEKLKQEGSPDYPTQVQKSILYYDNPLTFQYFIHSDAFYTEIEEKEMAVSPEIGEAVSMFHEAAVEESPVATLAPELPVLSPEETDSLPPAGDNTIEEETKPEAVSAVIGKTTDNPSLAVGTGTREGSADVPAEETAAGKMSPVLTFEPYHTVDYFASQGIKLSQEEIPKDKFGKQLKSFTEWLKTMKRIPPTQMTQQLEAGSDTKVQHLADDSIHDSKVYTEAMAEVWAKQGNLQKAMEIYNKLVLLNPSKKAYFATKIENLKRS